jgi:hypothetical protein
MERATSPLPVREWIPKIGIEIYDQEGRVVITDHGPFLLYNIYFPKWWQRSRAARFQASFLTRIERTFG